MISRSAIFDRKALYLMPPYVKDWLPENHLARFAVEIVSKLGLIAPENACADPYHSGNASGFFVLSPL